MILIPGLQHISLVVVVVGGWCGCLGRWSLVLDNALATNPSNRLELAWTKCPAWSRT